MTNTMDTTSAHDVFERLVSDLDYPMLVVTAVSNGDRAGCLVGFATQSSIDPPRMTVWISEMNRTAAVAAGAATLAVHVLRETDQALAALFGAETGDEVDKFDQVSWTASDDGPPIIAGCGYFIGRVVERLVGLGDHCGYVLAPEDGERLYAGLPQLGYQRVRDMRPGHPV
jgi:flavin reductase (DIM6/NTAB) family NADH-FMN oxidoreductase RutF